MTPSGKSYKKIVIKVGSSLFCSKSGEFEAAALNKLVKQLSGLANDSKVKFVIVSSGAIALGMLQLKLSFRPRELSVLQAAAAIGQNILMDSYSKAFKGQNIAQILLTWDDFNDRNRYLNAKKTLDTLLELNCIQIVNENDTVSIDEIKFGDNDRLSALVATMISADLLIILSDVDGLLDKDKKLIKVVEEINSQIKALASPSEKKTSVGGMITKIEAAKISVDSGIPCVIASGHAENIICRIASDPFSRGTWTVFAPQKGLTERDRWIAFGTKPKGKIIVDDGAKKALLNCKSLLSVGITGVEGNFEDGSVVSVMDKSGCEFARGKVSVSSKIIDEVKGQHFAREIIHRDNIVILN
ncbi:MAG: glutamate 5-kinase [Candidatus Omnitrophica bacterium]|nr:glutamate 5-kinase [Candidatus Omnitrophota bacterium]